MSGLVDWQDLPLWVPGQIHLSSENLGWKNVALRGYHYEGQDVLVPAMKDFMLVGYRSGVTPMQRQFDGRWSKETLSPGAASFLTRAQAAHWVWQAAIDVTHIYISRVMMNEVADELFDCTVSEVALEDVLRTEDPMISNALNMLANEAQVGGWGGPLFVESLTRALIVHLLRRYSRIKTRTEQTGQLSTAQKRLIQEFAEENLALSLDLTAMASELNMTPCLFARQFKATFGIPPHAYIMSRRVDRARRLLAGSKLALKQISADCGFSDQAHMTRLFRRQHGTTPLAYRRDFAKQPLPCTT